MEPFVAGFVRASLVWLGVGGSLGLWMTFSPAALGYRSAHMHANLLGFVSMMIFGVAYHVIPRISGSPLRHRRLARIHLWVANLGLALMVGGWMVRAHEPEPGGWILRAGAVTSGVGTALFIYVLWMTLRAAPPPARTPPATPDPRKVLHTLRTPMGPPQP